MSAETATAPSAGAHSIHPGPTTSPVGTGRLLIVGLGRLAPPLGEGLEAEGFGPVDHTDCEAEARQLARNDDVGLVLVGTEIDTDLFGMIYDLRAALPHTSILFLSPSSRPEPALRALASGADDVVTPPHSVTNVRLRVRILQGNERLRHGLVSDPRANGKGRIVVDRLSRTVARDGDELRLTGREFELLERLLERRGEVASRESLLTDIWGASQRSEAVLDATVHRLRQKLEDDPARPRILGTVRGKGYRLEVRRLRVVGV